MFTGLSFINNEWSSQGEGSFNAINAFDHTPLEPAFKNCSLKQLAQACDVADAAFKIYRKTSKAQRAAFLNTIADELASKEDELVARTPLETGLPEMRIKGELGRTVGQLRLFAANLEKDAEFIAEDAALPERQPLPRPTLKMAKIAIGPVAVFGASNFPLAFSAAGGDTASALAAGCPVVYKSHSAHPGTSEIVVRAIESAITKCGMPKGVYQLLHSKSYDVSHELVKNPKIQAVGFTGSFGVGMALQDSIKQRKQQIPFYGELGSTNPQVLLSGFVEGQEEKLAATFIASLNMGAGQFCTNPGLWLIAEEEAESFKQAVAKEVEVSAPQAMLTPAILKAYKSGCENFANNATLVASGQSEALRCSTQVFATTATEFRNNKALHEEVFGPAALIVTYSSNDELVALIDELEGQLTATIHGSEALVQQHAEIVDALSYVVGRLIYNQMPTGVEVCDAMMHGGPFPSSTDVRSTSVGSQAIERFLRPLCIQNAF